MQVEEKHDLQVEIISFVRSEGIEGRNRKGFGCVSLCQMRNSKNRDSRLITIAMNLIM